MKKIKPCFPQAAHQSGVMLIEALVALLIFSVGILGLVGLQAAATRASSDAKYRSEAALLANDLIGTMWTSNRTNLPAAFASPAGLNYQAWANANVNPILPGSAANPPTVTVVPAVAATPNVFVVTVTIFWAAPDNPATVHQYVTQVQIGA